MRGREESGELPIFIHNHKHSEKAQTYEAEKFLCEAIWPESCVCCYELYR